MEEINDNIFLEGQQEEMIRKQEDQEQQEDMIREQEDQVEEKSIEDNIQVIENVKETKNDKEIDKKIEIFLHEKDSNENLSETLINILMDEHVSEDDIDNLQDLSQAKIKVNKSNDSIINFTSGSLSSNGLHEQLPSNSIYLKRVLSKPLIQALCEIITKKPADPVEYLGHWLLHFKVNL
ncbi:PREDICTED: WD repeat-containing protein 87-like isoform X2 [Trachymyrmex septentrionalis]|uniref:WD repeat-containing protein 87-like isoform X2 n=1 Tax=Trachymyrmex septentrionalis TaxID=34720 RepID=UPI00084F0132|nr:PREDICTED: WD repeat-containing protein 87-like isoform X2 [Trachymyrmex septentrionalis]